MDSKEYSTYRDCAYKYKLKYIDRISVDPTIKQLKRKLFNYGVKGLITKKLNKNNLLTSVLAKANELKIEDKIMVNNVYRMVATFLLKELDSLPALEVDFHLEKKLASIDLSAEVDFIDFNKNLEIIEIITTDNNSASEYAISRSPFLLFQQLISGVNNIRIIDIIHKKDGISIKNLNVGTDKFHLKLIKEDIQEVASAINDKQFLKASINSFHCNKSSCAYWSICRGKDG